MRIAVPQETAPGERRVALVPESCKKLVQAGYEVSVETDAGRDAGYSDAAYREAGATIETDRSALVSGADILLIETIFSLDGLGLLSFESIEKRDYPVVFATLWIFSLLGLVVNLISDFVYTLVDPRIDFESREV